MVQSLFKYLSERFWLNLCLVIGYAVFIVFAHDFFVSVSIAVMNYLSLELYNTAVVGLGFLVMSMLIFLVLKEARIQRNIEYAGILYLVISVIGLVVHYFVYMEMNIEFIHAMEFGFLACLIYPLVGRFSAAIIYSLPVMLVDEWYQYQILYPDFVEYFDFNDLQLDLLGSGLFLSLLIVFKVEVNKTDVHPAARAEYYLALVLVVIILWLLKSKLLVLYPELAEEHTWLVLNAIKEPYDFWRVHPEHGSIYHVIEPIPGLITVFSICLAYLPMDWVIGDK